MALSFKGHAPDFQYWVFNIDGRDWVAVNQSTPQPLKIQFQGRYRAWPATLPLIKGSGFDIVSGTTSKTNDIGEKQGSVEWIWNGKRYKSTWVTTAGNEVVMADPEEGIPAEFDYQLNFVGMIPYEGPVTGPVGTGIESEATKQVRQAEEAAKQPIPTPVPSLPIDTSLISDTKDSLDNANRALAVSEAQRKVDLQALNTARAEIENAKQSLADAQAMATASQQALLAQMREQLQVMQERADVQVNIYRQMLASQQAPPVTSPVVTSPVVTTPTKTPATAPSGTDWVKLGLQLGAAYLILS